MAKHDEDLGDVQAIYADIGRFRRMTIPDLIKHYEEHPEDKLHHVYLPNRSHRPMSRDAGIRFGELAWRHQQSDPAGDDLDLESLDKSIRERFVAMFIANRLPIQRSNVQKMLHSAAKASRKEHERLTHYVPCVVVAGSDPVEFTIGPLRFLTTQKFFEENRKKIEEDLLGFPANETGAAEKIREPTSRPEETARIKQQLLDSVIEYYQQYPWIAELTVPPCDAAESGRRAETATQRSTRPFKTSLRLLRLPLPARECTEAGEISCTAGDLRSLEEWALFCERRLTLFLKPYWAL